MALQNVLFNQKVRAGSRTYFMDVKETKDGKPYLSIQESRKKDEGFEKSRMLVFQDHLQDFLKGIISVQGFIESHEPTKEDRGPSPTPTVEDEADLPF